MLNTERVEKAAPEHESTVSIIPIPAGGTAISVSSSSDRGSRLKGMVARTQCRGKQDETCSTNKEAARPEDPHSPPYDGVAEHHLHTHLVRS